MRADEREGTPPLARFDCLVQVKWNFNCGSDKGVMPVRFGGLGFAQGQVDLPVALGNLKS